MKKEMYDYACCSTVVRAIVSIDSINSRRNVFSFSFFLVFFFLFA